MWTSEPIDVAAMRDRIATLEAQLAAADRLAKASELETQTRQQYEATATDRGWSHGPKGRAMAAWMDARAEVIVSTAAYRAIRGGGNG